MSILRESLALSNSAKKMVRIVVVGTGCESHFETLKNKFGGYSNVSMESQQMGSDVVDNTGKGSEPEGKMNVYVVNPKQTGFHSAAAMTMDILRNPENTAITLIEAEGDPMTEEERNDMENAKELLKNAGAQVYDNIEDMSQAVDKAINESDEEEDTSGDDKKPDTGDAGTDDDKKDEPDPEDKKEGEEEEKKTEGDEEDKEDASEEKSDGDQDSADDEEKTDEDEEDEFSV